MKVSSRHKHTAIQTNASSDILKHKDNTLPGEVEVQISTTGFESLWHKQVLFTGNKGFRVRNSGDDTWTNHDPGEKMSITEDDIAHGDGVVIIPEEDGTLVIETIERNYGFFECQGTLLVEREEKGLVIKNRLPLDSYLCSVVASEMPEWFPFEALKAQAVCARTFAYLKICEGKKLSDGTGDQVYNNIKFSEIIRQAVMQTEGEILSVDTIQYYSSSMGQTREQNLSTEEDFREFLNSVPRNGIEYNSPWIRWTARLDKQKLASQISQLFTDIDNLTVDFEKLQIEERRTDGRVEAISIDIDGNKEEITDEYRIRCLFGDTDMVLTLADGSVRSDLQLLPSAYFCLKRIKDADYLYLQGGGFGHGDGMSQYGAAELAENGVDYLGILDYYMERHTRNKNGSF